MTVTALTSWEAAARLFEPPRRKWSTPGELAQVIKPKTVQTPALDLIDAALVEAASTPDSRLIITLAPQEGKSTRVAQDFVLWQLATDPDMSVVSASYAKSLANRNGRTVRNLVNANADTLGIRIAADNGSASEWQIAGREGGLYSVGLGGGVTGRKANLLIIDDPIKDRAQADSDTYRDTAWDWWTDAANSRLAPGASVVMILTRWHHDDLAGRLLAEEGSRWKLLNIPARADHDPDKGETDPLDREPGEYMLSAQGRTREQWEQREKAAGKRGWASLYQGRPTPDTGNLFPRDGWARYTRPLWLVRDDGSRWLPGVGPASDSEIIQSWDLAFKDTKTSDYVVGQVWLRKGTRVYLLDQVRRRMGFSETCQAMRDMSAKWPQAIAKLVEDKANGPAVLNALRGQIAGLIPVEPEGSKYARATAVTPLVEAKDVVLPDPSLVEGTAWVTDLTDEAADFPGSKNDDTVDAFSQGVHRLLLVPILDESVHEAEEFMDDGPVLGWATA